VLATAGSFVRLEALLLGLDRLVPDPKPPRQLVLAIGPAHSDVAEFVARASFAAPSGTCRPAATARPRVSR